MSNRPVWCSKCFDIYHSSDGGYTITICQVGIDAWFDTYEAAKLAISKDLNQIEEMYVGMKPRALTLEDLKGLDDSNCGSCSGSDHTGD